MDKAQLEKKFAILKSAMERDRMYLTQGIMRQQIMEMLGLDHNQLTKMLHLFADGVSITKYIDRYRVDYACKLLRGCPQMSIQEIGKKSGFKVQRTFNINFREMTGMSPDEYRKQMK